MVQTNCYFNDHFTPHKPLKPVDAQKTIYLLWRRFMGPVHFLGADSETAAWLWLSHSLPCMHCCLCCNYMHRKAAIRWSRISLSFIFKAHRVSKYIFLSRCSVLMQADCREILSTSLNRTHRRNRLSCQEQPARPENRFWAGTRSWTPEASTLMEIMGLRFSKKTNL